MNTPKTYTSISLRKTARQPSAALQPPRTPDTQYLPPSCCTTHPFRPPMFQRANPPHYFHPHKQNPREPPPPAKPVPRQKDYNDNEKLKLKKPILRCVNKRNTHPYHPLRVSGTFSTDASWPHHCRRPKEPPRQLAQRNKATVKPPQDGLKPPPRDAEGRVETIQFYVRPRTSSSATTSLLLSMSHTLSSLALCTAEGSANSV